MSYRVFLLLCAGILVFSQDLRAEANSETCVEKSEHERLTYLLVDRSDTLEDEEGFRKTMLALKQMIQPGERLVVGLSKDRGGDTQIIMDIASPIASVWESTLKIRAQQKKFTECLNFVTAHLLGAKEKYDHSAILETLSFVGKVVAADRSHKKRMIIYSDMMQNSPSVSFFGMKTFSTDAVLKLVEKEQLVAKLQNVEVFAAGTGAHVSDKKARDLESFWSAYFEKAGAVLKFYGPVLVDVG